MDDKTAVECCVLFLRDHQLLVEPACGATLAAVYSGKVKLKVNAGKAKRIIRNGTVNTKNNKILRFRDSIIPRSFYLFFIILQRRP